MCRYRKSLFACNHSHLSTEPLIICPTHRAYLLGSSPPCDVVHTHRCSTIRVARLCEHCSAKKTRTDQRLSDVKTRMAELRRHLRETYGDHIKAEGGSGEEKEKTEKTDEVVVVDPVEEFLKSKMTEKYSHLMMWGQASEQRKEKF